MVYICRELCVTANGVILVDVQLSDHTFKSFPNKPTIQQTNSSPRPLDVLSLEQKKVENSKCSLQLFMYITICHLYSVNKITPSKMTDRGDLA